MLGADHHARLAREHAEQICGRPAHRDLDVGVVDHLDVVDDRELLADVTAALGREVEIGLDGLGVEHLAVLEGDSLSEGQSQLLCVLAELPLGGEPGAEVPVSVPLEQGFVDQVQECRPERGRPRGIERCRRGVVRDLEHLGTQVLRRLLAASAATRGERDQERRDRNDRGYSLQL